MVPRDDIKLLRRRVKELEQDKQAALTAAQSEASIAKVNGWFALASGAVAGLFALGGAVWLAVVNDNPTPIDCMDRRADAVRLVDGTHTWIPLPEDTPLQEQCDINGYVQEYLGD